MIVRAPIGPTKEDFMLVTGAWCIVLGLICVACVTIKTLVANVNGAAVLNGASYWVWSIGNFFTVISASVFYLLSLGTGDWLVACAVGFLLLGFSLLVAWARSRNDTTAPEART